MGSVTKRIEKGEDLGWQYRWREPGGNQKRKVFGRKSDAEQFAAKIENDLRNRTYVDPAKGKQTFRAFAENWRQVSTRSPNYAAGVESTLRLHVYPAIGSLEIAAINEQDIQKLAVALTAKGFVPSTVRNYLTLVRTIFKAAARQKAISGSPCLDVKLPKAPPAKVTPLDAYSVHAIKSHIEPRYKAMVDLSALTGGRQGEIFGLRVEDIVADEGAEAVYFRQQLQVERGKGVVVRPLKNREERMVPVPAETIAFLWAHIEQFPPSPEGLIFTRPGGKRMHARMFNGRPWARARKAAAAEFYLGASAYGPGQQRKAMQNRVRAQKIETATFHDLRDHFASLLIHKGASVTDVSRLLGHASQATTLNHYAHLWGDHADRTRSIMAAHAHDLNAGVSTSRPVEIN